VGLSAAKVRLQLDDRIAAAAAQPLGRADQKRAQTVSQKGPGEELARVPVF